MSIHQKTDTNCPRFCFFNCPLSKYFLTFQDISITLTIWLNNQIIKINQVLTLRYETPFAVPVKTDNLLVAYYIKRRPSCRFQLRLVTNKIPHCEPNPTYERVIEVPKKLGLGFESTLRWETIIYMNYA